MVKRIYIASTGAGAGAQNKIWSVPGCSSYFAGACFPYGQDQVDEFLGFKPAQYCSKETALSLAMASYMRAWNGKDCDAVGVGLTASVASKEAHRGEHRIHAAICDAKSVIACDHVLKKGKGAEPRSRDGRKADRVIMGLIRLVTRGKASGLDAYMANEQATEQFFTRPFFGVCGDRPMLFANKTLYCGAFNPPHYGHFQIAEAAGPATTFNITQDSPHKPPLSLTDMLQRAKLFKGHRLLFTRGDPLYIDKARLAPGTTFVVGADSLLRMLDPKWGPDVKTMLYEFIKLYTTFLVAPRKMAGETLTMHQVLDRCGVDYAIRNDLFKELTGFEPVEMSSTQIRSEQ